MNKKILEQIYKDIREIKNSLSSAGLKPFKPSKDYLKNQILVDCPYCKSKYIEDDNRYVTKKWGRCEGCQYFNCPFNDEYTINK